MDGFSWGILGFMALLACPLMMGGMLLFGWMFARRASGSGGHSGHDMGCRMMMGHGHGRESKRESPEADAPVSAERHSHSADEY